MEISIVIPCYNHGHFIQDALDSVANLQNVNHEVIIVDDGSFDKYTIDKLDKLREEGYTVLSHANRGLAYTRNRGIECAKGEYVLPLDADNKIKPEYIYKALNYLRSNQADIIYADPIFFGEQNLSRYYQTKDFDGYDLFNANYIDACAIYRREIWLALGGYDGNMPYQGHEDWEFWLHAFTKGYRFKYINEGLYYYRIVNGSMIEATVKTDAGNENQSYILHKHRTALMSSLQRLASRNRMFERDEQNPLRSSAKYLYRYINSLAKKRA